MKHWQLKILAASAKKEYVSNCICQNAQYTFVCRSATVKSNEVASKVHPFFNFDLAQPPDALSGTR
eukprot:6199348-Pleurochrysis_carterae.AAC.1